MPFGEDKTFQQTEQREMPGHEIEWKVGEFLAGSFDFIKHIERTQHEGKNDKKGIDLVIVFENGDKLAVDVTAANGVKIERKIESMKRSPLTVILEELNETGEVAVEKSKGLIPRALIRVDFERWEEYYVDSVDGEVIVNMGDEKIRLREEKDILQQLIRQIDYLSTGDSEYKDATEIMKETLLEALAELEEMEKEFT